MTNSDVHKAAACALLEARQRRVPVTPLTASYDGLEVADAYAIQQLQVAAWLSEGRRIIGRKVGLTSMAMQEQMGVDQPDFGVLRDDMRLDPEVPVDPDAFLAPRIEPEVAFRLGRSLHGPAVTAKEAAAAVDLVLPSLEVIDSRIRDWRITIVDTIADNASAGAFVLGGPGRGVADVDLAACRCVLLHNDRPVASGTGDAVLGNPLNSLAWLANTLAEHGIGLQAGQVVLPGSITASQPVAAGDRWTGRFEGIGEVTVEFRRVTDDQG